MPEMPEWKQLQNLDLIDAACRERLRDEMSGHH